MGVVRQLVAPVLAGCLVLSGCGGDAESGGGGDAAAPSSSTATAPATVARSTANVEGWIVGAREHLDEYRANDMGVLFVGYQLCEHVPISATEAEALGSSVDARLSNLTPADFSTLSGLAERTLCPGGVLLDFPSSVDTEVLWAMPDSRPEPDPEPAYEPEPTTESEPDTEISEAPEPSYEPEPFPEITEEPEPEPVPPCPSWKDLRGRVQVAGSSPAPDDMGQLVDIVMTVTNPRDYAIRFTGSLEYPSDGYGTPLLQEDYSSAFEDVTIPPGRHRLTTTVQDLDEQATSDNLRWSTWQTTDTTDYLEDAHCEQQFFIRE